VVDGTAVADAVADAAVGGETEAFVEGEAPPPDAQEASRTMAASAGKSRFIGAS
jgi:hypothetical protein